MWQVDNCPATNVNRSVVISMAGETTRLTGECRLVKTVGFRDIATSRTGLRSVSRVNSNNFDAGKFGFILNLCSQVCEVPGMLLSPLAFSNPYPVMNSLQVFKGEPATGALSLFNNILGDYVVYILSKAGFFAFAFLHQAFGRLCSFALQFLSKFRLSLPVIVNLITGKSFSIAVSGNIDNAQVNAQEIIRACLWRLGHINADVEVENTVSIYKISLPLNAPMLKYPVVAKDEGYVNSIGECFNIDGIGLLEFPDPFIIGNCAVFLETVEMFFVGLIAISDFTNHSDSQLRRKAKLVSSIVIAELMQADLPFGMFGPTDFRNIIAGLVENFHSFKKPLFLFWCCL